MIWIFKNKGTQKLIYVEGESYSEVIKILDNYDEPFEFLGLASEIK